MAAGIVYHNITTATGVTFSIACWVPDTTAPDVGAIPVTLPIKSDGSVADMTLIQSYTSRLLSGATPVGHATATATTGFAIGGTYNATPPTFLDTEQGGIQFDVNGRQLVTAKIDATQLSALSNSQGTMASPGFQQVGLPSDHPLIAVGGKTITQAASSTIIRPADTTAYTSGDLVANSTTAGSVTNLQFTTLARVSGGSGVIVGAKIQKSTNVTASVALRLHLFNTAPAYVTNGDNTAMTTVVVASAKGYLGYIDIATFVGFSDVAWGSGAPDNSRGSIPYVATAQIIYGLLEARGTFTPGNAEVFTVVLDALQD